MKSTRRIFLKAWGSVFIFYTVVFILFAAYLHFSGHTFLFSYENFLHWDAEHYHFISQQGYDWMRCAFFPLFPFVWKYTGLNAIGISIFNGLVFSAAIAWLIGDLKPGSPQFLLRLSVPSLVFMFYPYTESFFFLTGVLMLIGWKENKPLLTILGFFLCGMTRPAVLVMLPALLIAEWLSGSSLKMIIYRLVGPLAALAGGLICTVAIHHAYTGNWNSFLDAQAFWGNKLQFPSLPLRSWGGDAISRLDGVALLVSAGCFIPLFKILKRRIKNQKLPGEIKREVTFSLLYCAGSGLMVLLLRKGELYSLNRFVLASPFFFILLNDYLKIEFSSGRKLLWLFIGLSAWWLLFGSYVHIRALLKYEFLTAYLLLSAMINHPEKRIRVLSYSVLIGGNIFLLLYFYQRLLTGEWVG